MRKAYWTSALALGLLLLPLAAHSHGGGLSADGCHKNSKTGERHCHRSAGSKPSTSPQLVSGAVSLVSIGDGDTVRVASRSGERVTIRLACIDAPETAQGASGKWSTQMLERLIQGKSISLKPQVKDRYGRTVAEIFVGKTNINLQMVNEGAAYVYRQYLRQCDRDAYLRAESSAKNQRIGVWGSYKPAQRPWDFRRSARR